MNSRALLVGVSLLAYSTVRPVAATELSGPDLWLDVPASSVPARPGADWVSPGAGRLVSLLPAALDTLVSDPTIALRDSPHVITLPRPDGGMERFRIHEDAVMAPELAAWMASQGFLMRTYAGESLDHPGNTVRLDWGGPRGFHASVVGPAGNYYLDPRWRNDVAHYVSYFHADAMTRSAPFMCDVKTPSSIVGQKAESDRVAERTGGARRIYRLAIAATGEYTQFHGGTKTLAQAAIVTSVNRLNQIYVRDASVFLQLIANNQDAIYTSGLTDPYSNDDGGAMLDQNQSNLDSVIGSANYDIGHVFSTGGGGVATLESPCDSSLKARGVTGSSQPVGDAFDIDYVAHEVGHQFGGLHTFNSTSDACSGNRSGSAAYEPGSGSTIMAYAGICSPNNIQSNSDALFHYKSLDQILNFTAGTGAFSSVGNCSSKVSGINNADPTVNAGSDFTIPANTPFELTALNGNDSETGGSLTYAWEQYDLGPATSLAQGDTGGGALLRSYLPTSSPVRSIPRLSTMLGQTAAGPGELLPTTSRTLTFRVTARDNDPDGGRIGTDTMVVTTTTGAGPFAVTAPNGGESADGTVNVTWNVATTNAGSVNTPNVDIFFSDDDGASFTLVADDTPNDGAQTVTIPAGTNTSQARIKVKGSGNIFYDVSNASFTAIGDTEDTTPDAFDFINAIAPAQTSVLSNIVTITGISAPTTLTLSGHVSARVKVNGGPLQTGPVNINPGDTVRLRLLSAPTPGISRSVTVNIGGVTDTWTVSTTDTVPNPFDFVDTTAAPQVGVLSNTVTIKGFNTPTTLTLSGHSSARVKINGGPLQTGPVNINPGDKVRLRLVSATASGATRSVTVDIGGVTDTWTVTTATK